MLDVEAALARAQARLGIIPAEAAPAITAAPPMRTASTCRRWPRPRATPAIPVVGAGEAALRAGRPRGGALDALGRHHPGHHGQRLVLQMRDGLDADRGRSRALHRGASRRMARTHRDTVMAGRTHLQHALPVTFGYKVAVWLSPLITMRERLRAAAPARAARCNSAAPPARWPRSATQGAARAGGAGEGARPRRARTSPGTSRATASRRRSAGARHALRRAGQDRHRRDPADADRGRRRCRSPTSHGRGGSSTMPQKRNPIACEYIIAQSRGVHALVPQVLAAMAQDQERGTGPWQAEPLARRPGLPAGAWRADPGADASPRGWWWTPRACAATSTAPAG